MKVFQLIDVNSINLHSPRKKTKTVDWSLCFICQQEKKGESLRDPKRNPRHDDGALTSLAENIDQFSTLNGLPNFVDIGALRGSVKLAQSLESHSAVYHRSCSLLFNNSKLERLKRRAPSENKENDSVSMTRSSLSLSRHEEDTCIFCDLPESRSHPLSAISTVDSDKQIRECAAEIGADKILVLAGGGSLTGQQYHKKCRTGFLNKRRSKTDDSGNFRSQAHGVVLARLIDHMREVRAHAQSSKPPAWKMCELKRLYSAEMTALGVPCEGHSSRLRDDLLIECDELECSGSDGQSYLIAFRKDLDGSLREDCKLRNFGQDGFCLSQAAAIIRKDLFSAEYDKGSVPLSLKSLVKMLVSGSGLQSPEDEDDTIVATLSELISFHASKRSRTGKFIRHNKERETPTPVFVATKLYGETRSKELIDVFHKLGCSISYSRLQKILDEKASLAAMTYVQEGVVCPSALMKNVLTIGAADNLDHDTSSTTAKTSFHGTAISVMQFPTPNAPGEPRTPAAVISNVQSQSAKFQLPDDYATVRVSFLDPKRGKPTPCELSYSGTTDVSSAMEGERRWLESCLTPLNCTTWSDFHSSDDVLLPKGDFKTQISVLPVFHEQAHTMSMMAHSMGVVAKVVKHVNPSQTPIMVVDQPLFALCKSIQWQEPQLAEDKFFVMFGGMHIELAALRVVGQWLNGSGWTDALVEAGITTSGRADALTKASHLARSRYAHQVTAAALFRLAHDAYETSAADDPLSYEDWRMERRKSYVMFRFWDIALQLELIVLEFVRALRTANFKLYKEALKKLVPWFFALDHVNYARWLPVHIRDLVNLPDSHPSIHTHFEEGLFVARLSGNSFSAIALDQAHEQQNAKLKGDGGMIGLTENPTSLRKWMLATPELAHLNAQFEENLYSNEKSPGVHHHASPKARENFLKDVAALESTIKAMGNPFFDEGKELYTISGNKTVCPAQVGEAVFKVEEMGMLQYHTFFKTRLEECTVSLYETIRQNKVPLFSTSTKFPPKVKEQLKSLKQDCRLFGDLFVSTSLNRPAELDEFFSHENNEYPPSLSLHGGLRSTTKADLYKSLMQLAPGEESERRPMVDAMILDGGAVIHMLKPGTAVTFENYVQSVFLPFIKNQCENVLRLDIVWDRYLKDSVKSVTRDKRGEGVRQKVTLGTRLPKKGWENFLRHPENKTELFQLLAESVRDTCVPGKVLCSTYGESVVTTPVQETQHLAPCNHEEADARIFVHVADAVRVGHRRIMVRTSDTDVVVIGVSTLPKLSDLKELWVHLKAGKQNHYIPIHQIVITLGPAKSLAMIGFHAFTGCDSVSCFYMIGKMKALMALDSYPEAIDAFIALSEGKIEEAFPRLINFVICMYSPSKMYESLTACRRALFTKFGRSMENLPPTEDALMQHVLRACLQAMIWRQSTTRHQLIPSPEKYGWKKNAHALVPLWRTLPIAANSCKALVHCKCKSVCNRNCSCNKKNITCGEKCRCKCNN